MGAYTSTYTANYPSSAGVEEGYSFPSISVGSRLALRADEPKVLDGWNESEEDFLMSRTSIAPIPATFVRISGSWSQVNLIPPTYERLLGGGHETPATLTDLTELLAADLITEDQYDAAIATVT